MANFFNKLHPKTRFLFSAIFVILGIAALLWFTFFFLLNRVRSESAEIEAAKIRRAAIETRRSETKREETALAELQEGIARIEEAFIDRPLVFFEFLEDIALRNNLAISLSLEDGAAAEKPEQLRVTVTGAYRNLIRFVRNIESSPYETDIRAVTVQMTNQRPMFSDSLARFIIDLKIISK